MTVPFPDGLLSQFAGWEHLAEQDWHAYRHQYGKIGRMALILSAEEDSTNHHQLAKQADLLMRFYLFSAPGCRAC